MSSTFNPYEAPKTDFTDDQFVPEEVELATVVDRILARVIDYVLFMLAVVVLIAIGLLVELIASGAESAMEALNEIINSDNGPLFKLNLLDPIVWTAVIITHVIFLALHGFLLHRYGQTIGKRLLKIAMVDADTHKKVPLPRLFVLRYLVWDIPTLTVRPFYWIIRIVDLLFGLRKNRRTLHDLSANTKVIKVYKQLD